MENNPTWMPVVAAALSRNDGRWLLQRRRAGSHHGGLWEFPGGKVEQAETHRSALVRELREELALVLQQDRLTYAAFADGAVSRAGTPIVIKLYTARITPSEIAQILQDGEGGHTDWFTPDEALGLPRPPLDIILCTKLFAAPAK